MCRTPTIRTIAIAITSHRYFYGPAKTIKNDRQKLRSLAGSRLQNIRKSTWLVRRPVLVQEIKAQQSDTLHIIRGLNNWKYITTRILGAPKTSVGALVKYLSPLQCLGRTPRAAAYAESAHASASVETFACTGLHGTFLTLPM